MSKANQNAGPLAGLLVIDLTRVLAGPWATQMLADMGAEVIKVERPGTGDDTRGWGPPFYRDTNGQASDAGYYMAANRNKKSITVDLKSETGRDLIRKLATKADILIENFKVGGMARLGLDFETLSVLNPKLVYCSITGFGQTGPMKDLPGYDYMIQAMGGMMSITGRADDEPGAGPIRTGIAASDLFTGFYASSAILAALYHVQGGGKGQHIDLALLDCQMAGLINQVTNWMLDGQTPGRTGSNHPNLAPYGVYAAQDASFVLAIGNDGQFSRFCAFAGREELAQDSRFLTNADRVINRDALMACIIPVIASRPVDCWLEGLAAIDVPVGPILDIPQAFALPQSKSRDMTMTQTRADLAQPVRTPASPVKFSGTPVVDRNAPPKLGQDTAEVLADHLDLSEIDIARLSKNNVI
ncbi:MAG: CoA transferase [Robiginitomaculum sp.]|nr:MAG: CoA transferase [Robiginitomaculum sp.]